MTSNIISFLILVSLLNSIPGFSQQQECDLKRDKDGIKVYTCKTENDKFKSLRAEFTLQDVTITELERFLLDVGNYPNWQYNMVEALVLEKRSEKEVIYRSEIDAPWPLEDRELLMRFWSEGSKSGYTYFFAENTIYNYPETDGLVRVPFMKGQWKVKELTGKILQIEYMMHINPGGVVPAWLVNLAMAEGPHHTFRNLKQLINRHK